MWYLHRLKQRSDTECAPGGDHANLCLAWCRLGACLTHITCLNAAYIKAAFRRGIYARRRQLLLQAVTIPTFVLHGIKPSSPGVTAHVWMLLNREENCHVFTVTYLFCTETHCLLMKGVTQTWYLCFLTVTTTTTNVRRGSQGEDCKGQRPVSFNQKLCCNTVKPRPEAHMDMIHFEVFLKNIHLIPQDQIVQWHYL